MSNTLKLASDDNEYWEKKRKLWYNTSLGSAALYGSSLVVLALEDATPRTTPFVLSGMVVSGMAALGAFIKAGDSKAALTAAKSKFEFISEYESVDIVPGIDKESS